MGPANYCVHREQVSKLTIRLEIRLADYADFV